MNTSLHLLGVVPYHDEDDRRHVRSQHQSTNHLGHAELVYNQDCQIGHQTSDQNQDALFQVIRWHVDRPLHGGVQHPRQPQPNQDVDRVTPHSIGHRHVTIPLLGHHKAANRVRHTRPRSHDDQAHDNGRNLSQASKTKRAVNSEIREPSDQQAHRGEQSPQPLLRTGQNLVQHPHHGLPVRLWCLCFLCCFSLLGRHLCSVSLRDLYWLQVTHSTALVNRYRLPLTRNQDIPQVATGQNDTSHQVSTCPLLRAQRHLTALGRSQLPALSHGELPTFRCCNLTTRPCPSLDVAA
mmetsp:Transcript_5896/g.12648  ORF Transcript_5896/g.12648 Transcript_5896/m.12648 type:complete len:294 (+) Transcript_5896:336-1217(+)